MRHGLLRGRDHTEIGAVAAESEGMLAVALSRGGAPKRYVHTDPNEDAALFVSGSAGVVLAVADAHEGEVAASAALEHLLGDLAEAWAGSASLPREGWEDTARAAFLHLNEVVRREAARSRTPGSCTTLSVGVVRPLEGWLLHASMGDSHLFQCRGETAVDLGVRSSKEARRALGSYFLGWGDETEASLAAKCRFGAERLSDTRAVVLSTDGLSERHIGLPDAEAAVARCVLEVGERPAQLRPLQLARRVVEAALDAHSGHGAGDNVAVATLWLGNGPTPE